VPTRRAYQVFIDALMRVGHLNPQEVGRIRELFDDQLERSALLRETGKLLTELGGVPSVIVQARSELRAVQKVRFIPTRPGEILSVVVLDDGSVENRFILVEGLLPQEQLDRVHALLDEVTKGRSLRALKTHLTEVAEREKSELGALTRLSEGLLTSALDGVENTQEVIVEGHASLFRVSPDPERTKRLMLALEDRKQLLKLLHRTLDSENVQVFLGEDTDSESPLSVVAASFRRPGAGAEGALGLLGPTRMDYPQLVPLVGAVARAMGAALLDENRELAWPRADSDPDLPPKT
jgi:heat-inducible transcriptional repressor